MASLAVALVESALADRASSIILAERTVSSAWLIDPQFPTTTYLASAAAIASVANPWIARRWKRALWVWTGVLVVLRILGSAEPVLDVALAVALGVVVGSLVVLVLGSPNPEPGPLELLEGIRACGIEPVAIERAVDGTDEPHFRLRRADGPDLFVKVRTPDDRSSDLLNRLYRAIRLRSSEVDRPYSTLKRRVEHEALLLMAAERAGASLPRVRVDRRDRRWILVPRARSPRRGRRRARSTPPTSTTRC